LAERFLKPRWLYAIIPFYAIQSCIGTYITLRILELGGSVISVGLASSAHNISLIPSAFVGGKIADYMGRRRPLLALSSLGQLFTLSLIAMAGDINLIIGVYAIYSFFSSFSPTVFSLLLMDTVSKENLGEGSAISFKYMIYGSLAGNALGFLVLTSLPLTAVALLPVGFSTILLVLSVALVKDSKAATDRQAITFNPEALITRLAHLPVILLKVPRLEDFRGLARGARSAVTRDIPLIMATNVLFFLGTNLFFTSYTPFLKSNALSNLEITGLGIFVTCINGLASAKRFSRSSKRGDPGMIVEFMSLRAIAFLFGAIESLYFFGHSVLYVTLLLYLLIGMAYTNITIGMNALLYRFLPKEGQGGTLGVYSALNSIAMFLGSFLSGNISFFLGYPVTFLLSSIALFSAASLFEWHFKPRRTVYEEPF
jgi:predicted MFS family arabinose efflux permease